MSLEEKEYFMKFLLVDDHWLFLDGLSKVLSLHLQGLEIYTANSVESALTIVTSEPDLSLIVVDLAIPDRDGLSLLKTLSENKVLIPAVILSACEDMIQIAQVMSLGASGFIPKTYNSEHLIAAIKVVLSGDIYLPESVKTKLAHVSHTAKSKRDIAHHFMITPRQLEVIALLEQGYNNQKIADVLFISEHTVKSHLKQIFQKLDCDSRLACINKAKSLEFI